MKLFNIVCFLVNQNFVESFCVKRFQSDFISIGNIENNFWAVPSSMVYIRALRLWILFERQLRGVLIDSETIFMIKITVTALK